MNIIAFKPEHLAAMRLQPMQMGARFDPGHAPALGEDAWTGIAEGAPVVCAGIMPLWAGRGMAWACLSADAGRHFMAIHRAAARVFALPRYRRVEAYVDPVWAPARRWVELLGFTREGLMRAFLPEGGDMLLYARIYGPR